MKVIETRKQFSVLIARRKQIIIAMKSFPQNDVVNVRSIVRSVDLNVLK